MAADLHLMASGVMDVISIVSTALQTTRRPLMTTKPAIDTKTCIGSERFGIEPHEAPTDDFPKQPSQKDGLGRMCREHWKAYTPLSCSSLGAGVPLSLLLCSALFCSLLVW